MYNTLDIVSEMTLLHPICIHFDLSFGYVADGAGASEYIEEIC